ncbi:MAG: hypothetical protein JWM90_2210 [Thermoleophilia bacterium]|nr:hypothetical protein [Thermoleophilia bacterium]
MGLIREADTPIVLDASGTIVRQVEAGDMTVEFDKLEADMDIDDLFTGLPNDMCQAEHWGYVIEGEMRYITASGEEIVAGPGDAYHVPPGHLPHTGHAGARVVEFSRTKELTETMRVVEQNMERSAQV